jgi:hypothetical protein
MRRGIGREMRSRRSGDSGTSHVLPFSVMFILANSARLWFISYVTVLSLAAIAYASHSSLPDLYEASLDDLQAGLEAGDFTSVDLIKVPQSFFP